MVMEKEYGAARMRKFLKFELDRYLRGRGGELIEELPLMRVENQPYIHYRKGSLIFYRLREEIGEDHVNRALARFIADKAYQSAPFTNTREFLDYLRPETPAQKTKLLDELFAKIVFYDDKITSATATRRSDGKYDVNIQFSAQKREADGTGKEAVLPMDDWLDVAAFARGADQKEASEKVLYQDKIHVLPQTRQLSIVVASKPYEVGIDPYNKLIDRIPDDNRKTVD
jgi:aminopeptidase N